VVKNHGNTQPLGLSQTDAQLFGRAQFTPDEVANLRKQFEQFDFVRISLSCFLPIYKADEGRTTIKRLLERTYSMQCRIWDMTPQQIEQMGSSEKLISDVKERLISRII
jgi:hypothetical protein